MMATSAGRVSPSAVAAPAPSPSARSVLFSRLHRSARVDDAPKMGQLLQFAQERFRIAPTTTMHARAHARPGRRQGYVSSGRPKTREALSRRNSSRTVGSSSSSSSCSMQCAGRIIGQLLPNMILRRP